MELQAIPARVADILPYREQYRREMNCQIIHDSLHGREGWTQPYLLAADGEHVGYGSIALGGPWQGMLTVFEYFVVPEHRQRAFDLFEVLLAIARPGRIEVQTNDPLLTVMLHVFARDICSEKILFRDGPATAHALPGAVFRKTMPDDVAGMRDGELDEHASWVVEVDGIIAAAGDVLCHYNPPYGDIYMKVAERYRRLGIGAYIVQELRRVCHERGKIPAARCNTDNVASRKTLQKAGLVPCGHLLVGIVQT